MFGVTLLMDELFKGLGIDPAQAKTVFEQIQKEAPDLIARIRTFDGRLAEIERTNQAILEMLGVTRVIGIGASAISPASQDANGTGHPIDTYPVGSARDDSANGAD
jgi:hypothetical protein